MLASKRSVPSNPFCTSSRLPSKDSELNPFITSLFRSTTEQIERDWSEGSLARWRAWNETSSPDLYREQAHAAHPSQADAHVRVWPASSLRYRRGRRFSPALPGGDRGRLRGWGSALPQD